MKNDKTDDKDSDEEILISKEIGEKQFEEKAKPSIRFFLNQRSICINLVAITLIWLAASFNMSLIGLQVKHLPGDFENNMIAMLISDLPAVILTAILVRSGFRPKRLFFGYMLCSAIASLSMITFVYIEASGIEMPILTGAARFGIKCSFTTLYMTHPSMFPTLFAATSMGIANTISRTLVMPAPVIAEYDYPRPMILFATLAFVASMASTFIIDDAKEIEKAAMSLKK